MAVTAGAESSTLDWTTAYTDDEYWALVKQYEIAADRIDLFAFAPFMYRLRPDALKRYRLFVNGVTQAVELPGGLPGFPYIQFMMLPFYAALGYEKGLLAEVKLARRLGASKAEVADILAVAWIHAGPNGQNHVASALDEFMNAWVEENGDRSGLRWPADWSIDESAFLSGVEFGPDTHKDQANVGAIMDWYRRVEGDVPPFVAILGEHYPLALTVFRARYENAMQSKVLPPQIVALSQLYLAASSANQDALRRTLHMTRHFGVARDHVVQALAQALTYQGDLFSNPGLSQVADSIRTW